MEEKKTIFSAIKPTGSLTIGNYIGALKNFKNFVDEYDCYYVVADLHSITIDMQPAELRKNTMSLLALYLSVGLSPDNCTLFVQSQVPAHAELSWVLNCYTQYGEAQRMTQFKDKSKKAPQNVNVGLFDYPVLMAADILLYQTDLVPIGKDQQQHLELARTIAERFNNKYSPTFTVPEGFYPKYGAKIYSLTDPTKKMGKSDENPNGYVLILDDEDTIMRKFKRAVTDSDSDIRYSADKPGISNLLTIYSAFSGRGVKDAEKEFLNIDYAAFKTRVAESVIEGLRPVRTRYNELLTQKDYLAEVMKVGREKAARAAYKTLSKVYKKVGFVLP